MSIQGIHSNYPAGGSVPQQNSGIDTKIRSLEQKLQKLNMEKGKAVQQKNEELKRKFEKQIQEIEKQIQQLRQQENGKSDEASTDTDAARQHGSDHPSDTENCIDTYA